MRKTQVKIGQSRHPNTLKLCRCSCSFLVKRELMGRRVNATLFNFWDWDKIIQGPWRNQGLQKTETTSKSKEDVSAQPVWLASRRDWAGTGCESVNASPRLAHTGTLTRTWGQRTTSTGKWKFHSPHYFHHLEDNTVSKVFSKFFHCTPSRTPFSWGPTELTLWELFWVLLLLPTRILLTITLLFKCSNTAPFPIQCPHIRALVIIQCQLLYNVAR